MPKPTASPTIKLPPDDQLLAAARIRWLTNKISEYEVLAIDAELRVINRTANHEGRKTSRMEHAQGIVSAAINYREQVAFLEAAQNTLADLQAGSSEATA